MRNFFRDRGGSYGIAVAAAMVPLLGGLAIAVDYAEMNRQKQATMNALDAAGIAAARHLVSGASDEAVKTYARDFFVANLGPVPPETTALNVTLPTTQSGGGTLKLSATLHYQPLFFPVFQSVRGEEISTDIAFNASTEIRMKNTLEVALVLDNSGSMDYTGTGSGQKRIELLKTAAKQLVDTIALQAQQIKQVDRPVQFSLVPFAGSVNVGPDNAGASWMDGFGLSPVHHENFDWATLTGNRTAEKSGGIWKKRGSDWGAAENEPLTRFSLYQDMQKVESREWVATGTEYVCTRYYSNGTCRTGQWRETGYYENTLGPYASWQGCVEARPWPLNVNDAAPDAGISDVGIAFGDGKTLFVPMFAPDEPGDRWATEADDSPDNYSAANNWWNDGTESSSGSTRQKNMAKYYEVRPFGATSPQGTGPNYSCTTRPITELTDVTTETGIAGIKGAIDAMGPNGATNVPEGIAWGWRTVSSTAPFTGGRPETERGNDKVVIVLTDGENTYYTPSSLGFSDPAGAKSTYSAYGYTAVAQDGQTTTRLLTGTSGLGSFDYSNANYTAALNQQMDAVCSNAKTAGVIVMTVALDLSSSNAAQAAQLAALEKCASESRFRKDASDPSKPAKLFWNATGGTLADIFKKIADELSNLRIIG
ncbi:MAG: pilus assembly protein [Rhizobiaceae bacterium]|nr:pilus assembly protein [Rhizobiaceae bacterium]